MVAESVLLLPDVEGGVLLLEVVDKGGLLLVVEVLVDVVLVVELWRSTVEASAGKIFAV